MMVSHIVLRRREPDLPRPYRTPGGTVDHRCRAGAGRAAVMATFLVDRTAALWTLVAFAVFLAYFALLQPAPPGRGGARGGVRGARRGRRRSCGDGPQGVARRAHLRPSRRWSEVLAKATPARSGDVLAGSPPTSDAERVAAQGGARRPAADHLPGRAGGRLRGGRRHPADPGHPRPATPSRRWPPLTVGGLRDWLLARSAEADEDAVTSLARGLTPEMVAAMSKLMRNADLIAVGRRARVVTGLRSHAGPARPAGHPVAAEPPRPTTRSG